MSARKNQSLKALVDVVKSNPKLSAKIPRESEEPEQYDKKTKMIGGVVVIFIASWFLLKYFSPDYIKVDGEVNNYRLAMYSVGWTAIIAAVIYFTKYRE